MDTKAAKSKFAAEQMRRSRSLLNTYSGGYNPIKLTTCMQNFVHEGHPGKLKQHFRHSGIACQIHLNGPSGSGGTSFFFSFDLPLAISFWGSKFVKLKLNAFGSLFPTKQLGYFILETASWHPKLTT